MWNRRIAIVLIVAALVGLFVCAGLLIQAYVTQQPGFELLAYSSFKPGFELLGFYALTFNISGCLSLIIALNISTLFGTEQKKLGSISGFIGAVLLFFSFGLLFISHKQGLEWWGYFSRVTFGTGNITITFYTLVGTERKRLRGILKFISYVLIVAAFVLSCFELRNVDAIITRI